MLRHERWLMPIAVVFGALLGYVDTRPGWDDTGVSALAVVVCAGLLGALAPRRPWLWALLVGGWLPALNIVLHGNYGALLAMPFALVGAYGGALAGRVLGGA